MASPFSSPAPSLPDYAELFCLSNFTFLQGASHAEELVARAVQLGYSALALTDECSLAGVVRAHAEAKKAALPLIVGAHFHLNNADGSAALSLVLLAQNRNGYGNLSELITIARTRSEKGTYLLTPADFAAPPPALAHLKGLPDCLAILLPAYPGHDAADVDRLHAQAAWMAATFPGRAWIGLNLLHRAFDDAHRATIEEVAWQHALPITALGHVVHARALAQALAGHAVGDPHRQAGGRMRLRAGAERRAAPARAPAPGQHLRARGAGRNDPHRAPVHLFARRAALRISERGGAGRPHARPATCAAKPTSARTGVSATASRPRCRRSSSTSWR